MGTRTKSYAKPFFFFWPVCSVNTVYSIHSSLVYFLCSIICCCSMSATHATRTIKLRSALMSSQRIQDSNCTRSSLLIVPVLQFKWKCGCGVLEDCFQRWPGHRCQLRYIQVYYGLGKPCSRSHANDKTSREDKKDQDCRLHTGLGCNSSVLSRSIHQTQCVFSSCPISWHLSFKHLLWHLLDVLCFCPLEGAHRTKKCRKPRSTPWLLWTQFDLSHLAQTDHERDIQQIYSRLFWNNMQQTKHKFLGNLQTF